MPVRHATREDAARMAELAEQKRDQYPPHNRPFHNPARNAREAHEPFLAGLTEQDDFLIFVHESNGEVDGFVVVMLGSVPPSTTSAG
jgi:hypothetical protein